MVSRDFADHDARADHDTRADHDAFADHDACADPPIPLISSQSVSVDFFSQLRNWAIAHRLTNHQKVGGYDALSVLRPFSLSAC